MNKRKNLLLCLLILIISIIFFMNSSVSAQWWESIPPYNLLWPLFVPELSPVDALSGLPTPIVNTLQRDTVLPKWPVWVWNPNRSYPYFLFNGPWTSNLQFYDYYSGFHPFPDPTNVTIPPITLPANWPFAVPPFSQVDFAIMANTATLTYVVEALYKNILLYDPLTLTLGTPLTPAAPFYPFTIGYRQILDPLQLIGNPPAIWPGWSEIPLSGPGTTTWF